MYSRHSRSSSSSPASTNQRHHSFAHEIMRSEFGKLGHLNDDQWSDLTDIGPDELAKKRRLVIWGAA